MHNKLISYKQPFTQKLSHQLSEEVGIACFGEQKSHSSHRGEEMMFTEVQEKVSDARGVQSKVLQFGEYFILMRDTFEISLHVRT